MVPKPKKVMYKAEFMGSPVVKAEPSPAYTKAQGSKPFTTPTTNNELRPIRLKTETNQSLKAPYLMLINEVLATNLDPVR